MTGQLAALTTVSEVILTAVVVASWAVGITDIVRLPGWAWRRAGKPRALWIVVIVVLAPVGLLAYVFAARPAVAALFEQGRVAALPLDGLDPVPAPGRPPGTPAPYGATSPPIGYGAAGAASPPGRREGSASPPYAQVRQQPITVAQEFRPSPPTAPIVPDRPAPTVPAGWKPDPSARHQFRYWDGFRWTESVADAGEVSSDPLGH